MPSFTLAKSFFILFIELLFVICLQYFNFKVEQNTKLLDNITFIHPVVILDIVAIWYIVAVYFNFIESILDEKKQTDIF